MVLSLIEVKIMVLNIVAVLETIGNARESFRGAATLGPRRVHRRLNSALVFTVHELPDFRDHDRPLANRGGNALDRSSARIAHCKDARP